MPHKTKQNRTVWRGVKTRYKRAKRSSEEDGIATKRLTENEVDLSIPLTPDERKSFLTLRRLSCSLALILTRSLFQCLPTRQVVSLLLLTSCLINVSSIDSAGTTFPESFKSSWNTGLTIS